jgi:hypothetical protein
VKFALILVGTVALAALLAAAAQKEGLYLHTSPLPWLFGTAQEIPVTVPTGEFPSDPARGAKPGVATARD